ncbi:MAG: RNA polymerase subunit sigma-70 [Phycisphaerae bacterium]|nr:RNA polymerase subunit sigma-70 [Phycisphaerae bacterium]
MRDQPTQPGEADRREPRGDPAFSDPACSDPAALFPVLYEELRRLAAAMLSRERAGHTLNPTALVHEAYMKLAAQRTHGWADRGAFIGVASQAMRRILVDHARAGGARKRGGHAQRIELTDAVCAFNDRAVDLLGLDAALDGLAALDARMAKLVEIRFFGGLSMEETATALGLPLRSAERDWNFARAYLRAKLSDEGVA